MTNERRALIELLDDLTSRLRNGCSKYTAISDLETALDEAENLPPKEDSE